MVSQMVLSLLMLSYVYELSNQYLMCLESTKMAQWFSQAFFQENYHELKCLVDLRWSKVDLFYRTYVSGC